MHIQMGTKNCKFLINLQIKSRVRALTGEMRKDTIRKYESGWHETGDIEWRRSS